MDTADSLSCWTIHPNNKSVKFLIEADTISNKFIPHWVWGMNKTQLIWLSDPVLVKTAKNNDIYQL